MRLLTVTDSDNIEAIGFKETRTEPVHGDVYGTLGVVFKSSPDTVHLYDDVSSDTFARLVGGDSVGKTFYELFRKTKYPFTKSARAAHDDLKK